MAEKALKLENIEKEYGQKIKTKVLHGISLEIDKHSFTAIIGQSGSGKSTLLNIIGTLDTPSAGSLTILGEKASQMDKNRLASLRNKTIGFIFQHHYLLPEFTALENILMPVRIQKGKVTWADYDYALELIDFVGLSSVKDNRATDMSGGQQQRTAIARALVNKPEIILADEPTGALDSDTTEKVYELIRKINETYNTTFIVITHDKTVAEKAARIIELKDGRVHMDVWTKNKGDHIRENLGAQ